MILVLLVCLVGCVKKKKKLGPRYPEDTEDTYLSASTRLCNHWWVLDSASINNIDYTDSVFNILDGYKLCIYSEVSQDINNPQYKYRRGTVSTQSNYGNLGLIVVNSNNFIPLNIYPSVTIFNKDTFISPVPYFCYPYTASWEIRKLSENELKIQFQRGDSLFVNYYTY